MLSNSENSFKHTSLQLGQAKENLNDLAVEFIFYFLDDWTEPRGKELIDC